ncbi:MAG: hypothetical protein ACLTS6_16195 [Anaerobutyricum sp.]
MPAQNTKKSIQKNGITYHMSETVCTCRDIDVEDWVEEVSVWG